MIKLSHREQFTTFLNECDLTGKGIEIGVCSGKFSRHILDTWKGEKLYLVDAWRYFEGVKGFENANHNEHLQRFVETFQTTYFDFSRAVIIKELSVDASLIFPDHYFDFVYIDAAHDYDNVSADLEAWFPKVKSGGLLAGHDYFDGDVHIRFVNERGEFVSDVVDSGHSDVKRAVDVFFSSMGMPVYSTDENMSSGDDMPSWWVIK